MFKNFIDILAAPNQVFIRLKEKPSWLVPWLVISILIASMQFGLYNLIDPEFLLDQLVEQNLRPGVSESDLRAGMQGIVENTNVLAVSSAVAIFIVLLFTFAISSAYLYLISRFTDNDISFKTWYSLNAWCSVPAVFTVLAAWVVILSSGGLIELEAVNPLNLNYLLFRSEGDFRSLLNSLNLITAWSVILIALGYKSFIECSYLKAFLIVFTPYILILLIWALVIAL